MSFIPAPFHIEPFEIIAEIVFTLLAVILSYAIYAKTRESYELTKHSGISYFRQAFLFLGFSYALRLFLLFTFVSQVAFPSPFHRELIFFPAILLVSYLSTISMVYLLISASSIWRRCTKGSLTWIAHTLAFVTAALSLIFRSPLALLGIQSILLLACIGFTLISAKNAKNPTAAKMKTFSRAKILYLLLILLWLINVWILNGRPLHELWVRLFFQLIAIVVFSIIYRKISKWIA